MWGANREWRMRGRESGEGDEEGNRMSDEKVETEAGREKKGWQRENRRVRGRENRWDTQWRRDKRWAWTMRKVEKMGKAIRPREHTNNVHLNDIYQVTLSYSVWKQVKNSDAVLLYRNAERFKSISICLRNIRQIQCKNMHVSQIRQKIQNQSLTEKNNNQLFEQ